MGGGETSKTTRAEQSRLIRGLAWLEIALGVVLLGAVSAYHVRDDSGTAAVLWLYSFPAAFLCFIAPGAMLFRRNRTRWVFQVVPLAFSFWLVLVLLAK